MIGRKNHNILVEEAIQLLKEQGITNISQEAKITSTALRVDILAFEDDAKIAVECQVQVQPKGIIKKIEKYKPHVDKLIFLIPPSEANKLKDITGIDEIWISKKIVDMKNIIIRNVPDKLYFQIVELRAKLNCSTWIEFLEKIAEKGEGKQ